MFEDYRQQGTVILLGLCRYGPSPQFLVLDFGFASHISDRFATDRASTNTSGHRFVIESLHHMGQILTQLQRSRERQFYKKLSNSIAKEKGNRSSESSKHLLRGSLTFWFDMTPSSYPVSPRGYRKLYCLL